MPIVSFHTTVCLFFLLSISLFASSSASLIESYFILFHNSSQKLNVNAFLSSDLENKMIRKLPIARPVLSDCLLLFSMFV